MTKVEKMIFVYPTEHFYWSSVASHTSAFWILLSTSSSLLNFLQPSIGYYSKVKRRTNVTLEDQLGNPIGKGDLANRFDYVELSTPFQFMFHRGKIHLLGGLGPYLSYAAGGEILYKSVSGLGSNEPKRRKMIFATNGYSCVDAGLTVLFSVILKKPVDIII